MRRPTTSRAARPSTPPATSSGRRRASNNEAEILLDQGHTDRAAGLFQDALRVYRASGYTFGAAVVLLNLARSEAAAGRFDEAHRLFDQAHTELAEIGSESFLLELDMRRAECFVLEGAHAEALELATATIEASEASGEAGPRLALLERVRGYAHIQARRPEEGRVRLEASLAAARESGNDFEAALTLRALSRPAAPSADRSRTTSCGDSASSRDALCPCLSLETMQGQTRPDDSRRSLSRLRSLALARRIANDSTGVPSLPKPDGSPRFRSVILVPPVGVSSHV